MTENSFPIQCSALTDQKFYYCYTLFIQKKSKDYKRGYMQKSLLIISEVYYKKLFLNMLEEFRHFYISEESKIPPLNTNIDNTIDDTISSDDSNQILNEKLKCLYDKFSNKNIKIDSEISIYPQNNNFFEHLSLFYVCKIWNLWELIITESPLIVQGENVEKCSNVVFLLSSLIFPLKFCGDLRPYFTLYESDFNDYKENEEILTTNSPLFGVINPIVVNSFKNIPVLHFDDYFVGGSKMNPSKGNFTKEDLEEKLTLPNYKRKFLLSPNKALIQTFIDFIGSNADSMDKMNIYLRMYLIELNNDFMRTFEEFFFVHEISSLKRIALIKPNFSIFEIFSAEKFTKFLKSSDNYFNLKYVKDKKKTVELYKIFIQTKCFKFYLKSLIERIKNLS